MASLIHQWSENVASGVHAVNSCVLVPSLPFCFLRAKSTHQSNFCVFALLRLAASVWVRGPQVSDPKCCDYDKRTPLHLAASEGSYKVAEWLLEQKADVNALDRFKRTPLEVCALLLHAIA